jgi:hypothetical protein
MKITYYYTMLCISTNGNKLPPYLILNRKTPPSPPQRCSSLGDMGLMEDRLGCILEYHPGALSRPQCPCNFVAISLIESEMGLEKKALI